MLLPKVLITNKSYTNVVATIYYVVKHFQISVYILQDLVLFHNAILYFQ